MPAFPTRRRLGLAALLLAALVALPGPAARSWANEAPAAAVEVTTSAAADLTAASKVEAKVEETTTTAPVEVKVEAEAKVAEVATAEVEIEETAKPAPVVVDDSSAEFKAGKDKAKDEPKAASKKDENKAEAKQDEVDCSNPLAGKGSLSTHYPTESWTFTVKDGCSYDAFLQSWALSTPYYSEPQSLLDSASGTFGPGTHELKVSLVASAAVNKQFGCFRQRDGGDGAPNPQGDWQYGGRLRVTAIGDVGACNLPEPTPEPEPTPVEKPEAPKEAVTPPVAKKAPAPVKKTKRIVVKKAAPVEHPELAGALPFTGPRDLLLPAGLGMLTLGLALVLATRRREAQLDIASRAVARALRKPYRGPRETL